MLLAPYLRTRLFDLDRIAGAGYKARRGLAVLKSFVGVINIKIGEVDLPNLFVAVGEAAEERPLPLAPATFCRWDGANQRIAGACGTH